MTIQALKVYLAYPSQDLVPVRRPLPGEDCNRYSEAVRDCGDTLFEFIFRELSEDTLTDVEAIGRMERAKADIQAIIDMFSAEHWSDKPEEKDHGTEDLCPKNPAGVHDPDWSTVELTHDGGEAYVDVNCIHCGRSGCVGSTRRLGEDVDW